MTEHYLTENSTYKPFASVGTQSECISFISPQLMRFTNSFCLCKKKYLHKCFVTFIYDTQYINVTNEL